MFCISCSWLCPGTSAPSVTHLTMSFYLCSSGSNTWGESRALKGCRVSSKKPFKGPRRSLGSCWEERRRITFPLWGSLICRQGESMIFYTSGPLIFACSWPPWPLWWVSRKNVNNIQWFGVRCHFRCIGGFAVFDSNYHKKKLRFPLVCDVRKFVFL